ncbi:MAG: MATE family efflux transporter [Sphaerochaetaceae bacterium]|jgi:putative MATE family efflux protein
MSRDVDLLDQSHSPTKVIWLLAWPVVLDQLFTTLLQYVDSAMVGSLGAVATAAVGANSSTIWLVNGLMYSFGVAFGVLVARHIGAGEKEAVGHTIRQAFIAIIAFSVVVTTIMRSIAFKLPYIIGVDESVAHDAGLYMSYIALAYPFTILFAYMANLLRSSGDTQSPLISNIITNVANIIGNTLLIFPTREISLFGSTFTLYGADLGVQGAAIATAGSTVLSALILFSVFLFKDSPIKTRLIGVKWGFDWHIFKQVFRLGTPLALERATLNMGQVAMTMIVTRLGTVALASHHLAITAESLTYLPVSGFSIAATTLVAQSLGANNKPLARQFARSSLRGGIVLMSSAGVLLYLLSVNLIGLLTRDVSVITLGSKVLRIVAFAQPFFAMSIVIGGILRGAGDTRWPFIYSIIGMWGVRLIPAIILSFFFVLPLEVVWLCMVADLTVRGLLNYYRYHKGTWVHAWDKHIAS